MGPCGLNSLWLANEFFNVSYSYRRVQCAAGGNKDRGRDGRDARIKIRSGEVKGAWLYYLLSLCWWWQNKTHLITKELGDRVL